MHFMYSEHCTCTRARCVCEVGDERDELSALVEDDVAAAAIDLR